MLILGAELQQGLHEESVLGCWGKVLFAGDTGQSIESSAQSQAFQSALLDGWQGHALHKVESILVGPVFLALLHDGNGSRLPQSLDGHQSVSDLAFGVHTKVGMRLVDVWSQYLYIHLVAFVQQFGSLLDVILASGEQGSHEF